MLTLQGINIAQKYNATKAMVNLCNSITLRMEYIVLLTFSGNGKGTSWALIEIGVGLAYS